MQALMERINSTFPYMPPHFGESGDRRFRKDFDLPKSSINCRASKNRVLIVFKEKSLKWTVCTFYLNDQTNHLVLAKRITKMVADFAVFSFILEELLECLTDNLESVKQNFPEDHEEIRDLNVRVAKTRDALQVEQRRPIEASTY